MNTEKACLGLCRSVLPANQLATKRLPSAKQCISSGSRGMTSARHQCKHVDEKGSSYAADTPRGLMHQGAQRMSSSTSCSHLGSQFQGYQVCFQPPCREETRGSKPLINAVTQRTADGLVPHANQHEQGQQPLWHRGTKHSKASQTCPRTAPEPA